MGQLRQVQTNFASGEVDPLAVFRTDTGAYQNGAALLTNAVLFNTGGCARRPGSAHLDTLVGRTRLIGFEFSADQRYVLALSDGRLDAYDTFGNLLDSVTSGCNWTADELFELNYTQSADTMLVVHKAFAPQIIKRTAAAVFTVTDFAFDRSINSQKIYQPYYKFAADAVTISCSATTGSVTVTANSAVFASSLVGQRIRWHDVEIEITAYVSTSQLTGTVKGTLRATLDVNPFKTTKGSTVVEVTHVGHNFPDGETVTFSGANGVGGVPSNELAGDKVINVISDNKYEITVTTAATEGIDGGGPAVKYTSKVTQTRNWSEPVFCTKNGWPGAVAFHEGRLWFGGTGGVPDGLWSSKIYQFFNFDIGEGLENESIQATIGNGDISNVRHLVSHRDLQIFTANGEFYATPPANSTLTPASMRVRRQTPYGSSMVAPRPFDGATVFVQASGKALREYIFSDAQNGYESTNLNVIAGHLLDAPHDLAVLYGSTTRSEQYALLVNSDGRIRLFHSARAESLAGWTSWETGGAGSPSFDAVCVIGDEIFVSVLRYDEYCLEKISNDLLHTLDGAVSYEAVSPISTWLVGPIFYGRTVSVNSGNYHLGTFTVSDEGVLELPSAVTEITVGYGYDFVVRTLPVHVELRNGAYTGLPKRINRVIAGLDTTLAMSISGNRLILQQVNDDFSAPPVPFTGTKEFYLLGFQRNAYVEVAQNEPLACTLLGLLMEVNI